MRRFPRQARAHGTTAIFSRRSALRRGAVAALLFVSLVGAAAADHAGARQEQRFSATVSRVRVDVIVLHDDEFVDDLTVDDFRIFEDGTEQQLMGVQLVDLPAGRLVDRSDGVADAAAGAAAVTIEADRDPAAGAAAARSSDFGAMVFLIDFPGLDFRNKARFTKAWTDLLADTDALRIPRAVYLIDQVGRLVEVAPLTQDPGVLLAAAESVAARSLTQRSARDEIIEDTQQGDEMVRTFRERARAVHTFDVLTHFSRGLATRPGRTALVWVSSGLPLMWEQPSFDIQSPNLLALNRQRAFHEAANSANVSVYAVDPTSRVELASGMADVRYGPISDTSDVTPGNWTRTLNPSIALDARRDALRNAAADTGGKAFIAHADLGKVLRQVEQDTGTFYVLSYAAPLPEGDGEYHDIRVEVTRDDVDVRARDGYIDYPESERRANLLGAALSLPGTVADLPLTAQATRSWGADGTVTVMLSAALDAAEVASTPHATGSTAGLEFHAVAFDGDDVLVEDHRNIYRRLDFAASRNFVRAADLFVYRNEWTLEPGDYSFRVIAIDQTSGRLGATRVDIEIPRDPLAGWRTSDLVLVEIVNGGARPVVGGRLPPGRAVAAFVEVYGGAAPTIRGTLAPTFAVAADAPQQIDLPAAAMPAEAGKLHRGMLQLPPLPSGSYRLEIEVRDASAQNGRSFTVDLEIMPATRRVSRR